MIELANSATLYAASMPTGAFPASLAPTSPGVDADGGPLKAQPGQAGVPLRVLIVEDSEDDARLLLRELRRGGYAPVFERVATPASLDAALERQTWDVVISDYVIPGFGGLAQLPQLRGRMGFGASLG